MEDEIYWLLPITPTKKLRLAIEQEQKFKELIKWEEMGASLAC